MARGDSTEVGRVLSKLAGAQMVPLQSSGRWHAAAGIGACSAGFCFGLIFACSVPFPLFCYALCAGKYITYFLIFQELTVKRPPGFFFKRL